LVVLDEPELHRRTPSPLLSLRKKGTPSHALLRSPPPPKIPLGRFAVLRHPCSARPHQERLVVAPRPPYRCSGHDTATRCVALPLSPVEAAVSHPHLDQRPRLDQEDTPSRFNLSRRLLSRRPPFNEVMWTRGLAAVDPVYGLCTYSINFAIEK
jgi:hypothetical protein